MSKRSSRPAKSWRAPFGPEEVLQRIRPEESFESIRNPHKGTATFQRFNGDPLYPGLSWNDSEGPTKFKPFRGDPSRLHNPRYPDTTVSYCRWVWSVIEPEKGKFRWDIVDGALEAARRRGQTLQMRIQPSAGGAPYPDWFWKSGASRCKADDLHPDFNCLAYVVHWTDLIRAWGARYDGHPDFESFDIAYAGSCGETGGNATPETAAQLADAYLDAFKKTRLVGMGGTHGFRHALAKRPDIGWRDDCFGDVNRDRYPGVVPDGANWNHMFDEYPRQLFECNRVDQWKRAPVTLETCWTVGYWWKRRWDIDWILDQGYKYHVSIFMPKSSFIPGPWRKKIDAFNRRIGYRFVLRQLVLPLEAKRGRPFSFNLWVDNVGVAPIYRAYKLAFRFTQGKSSAVVPSAQDIRTWLPDNNWFEETITMPATLRPGAARVDIGIVDPATDQPRVRFAVKGVGKDGWHPMSHMDVVAP